MVEAHATRSDLKAKVLCFAISSRIVVIFLSWISNAVIPDHNAGVYVFPQPTTVKKTLADEIVESMFGGLTRWDAQYFLHVAHYGYTYENTLAFFPLFPCIVRLLAHALYVIFVGNLNYFSTVLISATSINIFFFVNASLKLFELSCKILKDDNLAYKTALLFCINPASIFFTAIYSESCFAFFTFSGMLFWVEVKSKIWKNLLLAGLMLGLSSIVRSNGLINFGFIAHWVIKDIFLCLPYVLWKRNLNRTLCLAELAKFALALNCCLLCLCSVIFFTPFLLFQRYVFVTFCTSTASTDIPTFLYEFGKSRSYVLPSSDLSPWCNDTIPFSYSYVQNHYWDVGFLKYYQLKQVPNFFLAAPIIYLVLSCSYIFMLENKSVVFSLGLINIEHVSYRKKVLSPEFFVFVVHAVFLTIFCMFFVHVQVTTRMIASSSPVLYWFVALIYKTETSDKVSNSKQNDDVCESETKSLFETEENMTSIWKTIVVTETPSDVKSYCVRMYFYSYFIIGTIMFSNFLPWT